MSETNAFETHRTNPPNKFGFLRMLETWSFRLFNIIARFIFQLIYGVKGQTMPAISDPILLESASSLAKKIRNQEVITTFFVNYLIAINFHFSFFS